jgi:hypothetical protein
VQEGCSDLLLKQIIIPSCLFKIVETENRKVKQVLSGGLVSLGGGEDVVKGV